jgi:hypothetical protein
VWANGTGNEYKMPPENFDVYLNALLAFTRHDSQMVRVGDCLGITISFIFLNIAAESFILMEKYEITPVYK